MALLFDRVRVATATAGTGAITLGAAESGFQTFAAAGVAAGDVVSYGIEDGANWEVGTGTYNGTTLTRTVTASSNANAAISLSGSAKAFITMRADDVDRWIEVVTTADFTNSTTTFNAMSTAGASFLGFQMLAGVTYRVDAELLVSSAAAATGAQVGAYLQHIPDIVAAVTVRTTNGAAAEIVAFNTGALSQIKAVALNHPANNAITIATVSARVGHSVNSNFHIGLGSEVAASAVAVKAGSRLRYRRIT